MKKTPYIVIAILFVLFNVIAFAIPTDKTPSFWIAYVFTIVAFVVQALIWWRSIGKHQDMKSKLLGASVVHIGIVYFIIQLILFAIFMAVSSAPTWCVVLICTLVLGISTFCMITTNAGTEIITATEKKVAAKRQFIKDLQIEVEMLAETETDSDLKQRLTELAKKVRLSDPMSDESLSALEDEIIAKVSLIEKSDNKIEAIQTVETLLFKRNKKVKALKG